MICLCFELWKMSSKSSCLCSKSKFIACLEFKLYVLWIDLRKWVPTFLHSQYRNSVIDENTFSVIKSFHVLTLFFWGFFCFVFNPKGCLILTHTDMQDSFIHLISTQWVLTLSQALLQVSCECISEQNR